MLMHFVAISSHPIQLILKLEGFGLDVILNTNSSLLHFSLMVLAKSIQLLLGASFILYPFQNPLV